MIVLSQIEVIFFLKSTLVFAGWLIKEFHRPIMFNQDDELMKR